MVARIVAPPALSNHYYFSARGEFRNWLASHYATESEAWLCWPDPHTGLALLPYLEAVLEAICFGWIDGVEKRLDANWKAQRFSPRKPKGRWTELNKHRARQLISQGLMTDAGSQTLPDLDPEKWVFPEDIKAAIEGNEQALHYWLQMPEDYKRIRVDYIEERRKLPQEFQRALNSLIQKTAKGKLFGYFLPEIGLEPMGKEVMSYDVWKSQLDM